MKTTIRNLRKTVRILLEQPDKTFRPNAEWQNTILTINPEIKQYFGGSWEYDTSADEYYFSHGRSTTRLKSLAPMFYVYVLGPDDEVDVETIKHRDPDYSKMTCVAMNAMLQTGHFVNTFADDIGRGLYIKVDVGEVMDTIFEMIDDDPRCIGRLDDEAWHYKFENFADVLAFKNKICGIFKSKQFIKDYILPDIMLHDVKHYGTNDELKKLKEFLKNL